jgi:hypothetical protein
MNPKRRPPAQVLPEVPEAVRKSALMRCLESRVALQPPNTFPFLAEPARLGLQVAPAIDGTQVLFPELTPRDERRHIEQLFPVADKQFLEHRAGPRGTFVTYRAGQPNREPVP